MLMKAERQETLFATWFCSNGEWTLMTLKTKESKLDRVLLESSDLRLAEKTLSRTKTAQFASAGQEVGRCTTLSDIKWLYHKNWLVDSVRMWPKVHVCCRVLPSVCRKVCCVFDTRMLSLDLRKATFKKLENHSSVHDSPCLKNKATTTNFTEDMFIWL